ncbi:MAG TPA: SMP-30/gluconolactonase/LRE family protein [Kiloniellales bacterium]|jgi:sugar lactone lactonase YvrE
MTPAVFDSTPNILGEGPLWHPERQELFWFDILSHRLFNRTRGGLRHWQFSEAVSAAGWIDRNTLLVASASSLSCFDIEAGTTNFVVDMEHDNPVTRSNDGRADPYGGFWIGTMGFQKEEHAGSIYRYYRGEFRRLYGDITISNAICFSPDGGLAYFADTGDGKVMRQRLNPKDGWPTGEPELYLDLSKADFGVDGAVMDSQGRFWNAQWGGSRVACYSPQGNLVEEIRFPASQISCPAFGGANLSTLYATSARDGLSPEQLRNDPLAGQTFVVETRTRGQAEHQVVL